MSDQWRPSDRERHLEWWLELARKYLSAFVGIAGLVWETVIRGLQDPLAIIGFTMLSLSTNVGRYIRVLVRSAMADLKNLEQEEERGCDEPR